MHNSRTRLICRAHNRFNPSIALWQHFVEAHPTTPHGRRQLSTATPAAQDDATSNEKDAVSDSRSPPEDRRPQDSKVETGEAVGHARVQPWAVRKPTTTKGKWVPSKIEASITKNKALYAADAEALLEQRTKLLADTTRAFEKSKDYKGVIVKPMVHETPIKESALPWCLTGEERKIPGNSRLRLEIARFYQYATPDQNETIARKHLIEQMRNDLQKWVPEYKVEVFGSERTGLGMPLSDIDFRLVPQSEALDPAQARLPPTTEQRRENITILKKLYNEGFRRNKTYLLASVRHARYPLISVQDQRSGLDVQIVLANDTSISRVIMQDYMAEIPYLRELYWVVKTMFDTRGLSDVFRGGFGSYSLFMMVVASIKHAPRRPEDSAHALLNFLSFWSQFDTTKQGISIEPAFLYDKAEHPVFTNKARAKLKNGHGKPLPDYMLSLRDPADETNDLGRKGIAIKHVQATLRHLRHQLIKDTNLNTRPSILAPLVGSSYMLQLRPRKKLKAYGRWLEREARVALAQKANAVRTADQQTVEEGALKTTSAEKEEAPRKEVEEEETKQRLAREIRDREWQRLADERNEWLRNQAAKKSALEHSGATASMQGTPVAEESVVEESAVEESAVEEPAVEEPSVEGGAQPKTTV